MFKLERASLFWGSTEAPIHDDRIEFIVDADGVVNDELVDSILDRQYQGMSLRNRKTTRSDSIVVGGKLFPSQIYIAGNGFSFTFWDGEIISQSATLTEAKLFSINGETK
tara:strand:+ start:86 stop:415 length:330 start_codon:yes stop_codon:yes gene_type:complete